MLLLTHTETAKFILKGCTLLNMCLSFISNGTKHKEIQEAQAGNTTVEISLMGEKFLNNRSVNIDLFPR